MAAPDEETVAELIRGISDAAINDGDWSKPLDAFANAFGADCAIVEGIDHAAQMSEIRGSLTKFAFNDHDANEYIEHVFALNPRIEFAKTMQEGRAATDLVMAPKDLQSRSPFFDWMRSRTAVRHCVGTVLETGDGRLTVMGIHGQDASFLYDQKGIALIEAALPHIRDALRTHRTILAATARSGLLEAVVEDMNSAFAILRSDQSIEHANPAMRRLLNQQTLLCLTGGKLCPIDRSARRRFFRAIELARRGPAQVKVLKDTNGFPRLCRLIPAPQAHPESMVRPDQVGVLVYQFQVDCEHAFLLRDAFAFTPREIELALSLAKGRSLRQIADEWGVAMPTVKTHLQRAFQKTMTTRQSELIELIVQLLGRN